jgi:TatD DNase family protein
MLCVGWDLESSRKAIEIAHESDGVYAAVGIHPENLEGAEESDLALIEEFAKDPKVIAIGEIGLDYHWVKDPEARESQKRWFIRQIELANAVGLPCTIHARDSVEDAISILKEHPVAKGASLHCYGGSVEQMDIALKSIPNIYFGFGGPITFKNARVPKEAAAHCSADRILSETDSPYLSPEPFRGTTNESERIPLIVLSMAKLRGIPAEEMSAQLLANFRRLFHVE